MGGRESHPFGKVVFELKSASDRVSEKGSEQVPPGSAPELAKRPQKGFENVKKGALEALRRLRRGSLRGFASGEVQSVIFDNTHAL